jgi:hypothetical protein
MCRMTKEVAARPVVMVVSPPAEVYGKMGEVGV